MTNQFFIAYRTNCYLYFVKWNASYFGVNLMTGCKIFLRSEDYHRLQSLELQDIATDLLDGLTNGQFLIADDLDEFAILKLRYNHSIYVDDYRYRMTIMPTQNCNLNCWYCYEKHTDSKMSDDVIKRIERYTESLFQSHYIQEFLLDWFGGEPLIYFEEVLYPLSLKLMDLAKHYGIRFHNSITTNGVLIDQHRIEKFKDIKLNDFQITIDGNRSCHNASRIGKDKKGTYDRIVHNVNSIHRQIPDAHICIRTNYANKTLENIHEMIEDIDPTPNISFFMQRIWQNNENQDEVEEILDTVKNQIKRRGNIYEERYYTYGNGHRCYADSFNQVVINYDGKLYKCTARNFDDKTSVGYLDSTGRAHWNQRFYCRFQRIPFDTEPCRSCPIVPVCLGACSQQIWDDPDRLLSCDNTDKIKALENELYDGMLQYIEQYITLQKNINSSKEDLH